MAEKIAEKRNLKILIVDDHPMMLTMLRQILKQLGFERIREAESAETALRLLDQDDICMVFTDLGLPAMSGLELIQKIRENCATSDLPIIVLSGLSDQEMVLKALKAGADNFIVKPCSTATIKEKIIQVLSTRARSAACCPGAGPPSGP